MKKPGESLRDSYLEEGFILDKSFGIGQPRKIENAKILIANTPMDTDKIKIYGSRVSFLLFFSLFSSIKDDSNGFFIFFFVCCDLCGCVGAC